MKLVASLLLYSRKTFFNSCGLTHVRSFHRTSITMVLINFFSRTSLESISHLKCVLSTVVVTSRLHSDWAPSWITDSLAIDKTPKVRQVGDPVLREKAKPVEITYIFSPEMRKLMEVMTKVLHKKKAVGLAAPQIGVSLRVITVEFNGKHMKKALDVYGTDFVRSMGMSLFPQKFVFNPEIEIKNPALVGAREGCLSVDGYSAVVPRAKEVIVKGLDEKGKAVRLQVSGWVARIFQHEVDHLNGNLFVDSMLYKTFANDKWQDYIEDISFMD